MNTNITLNNAEIPVYDNIVRTFHTLDTNSASNLGMVESYENVNVIPTTENGDGNLFPSDIESLPKITTLDELLLYLSEVMIRFDNNPGYYMQDDFAVLIKTITNSLIYLYTTTIVELTPQQIADKLDTFDIKLAPEDTDYVILGEKQKTLIGDILAKVKGLAPAGGTTNQVLTKISNVDYEYAWVNQTGGSGGGGHVIEDNGTAKVQRTNLNIIGATITDDSVNDATVVTIPTVDLTGLATETYVTNITDTKVNITDNKMTETVGVAVTAFGIPAGTILTNKTPIEILDLMLYPELFPTLNPPTLTSAITPSGTLEIGTLTNIVLNGTFDRGTINPQYQSTSPYRSGVLTVYESSGAGLSGTNTSNSIPNPLVTDYTIVAGTQSWNLSASYGVGVQPKGSKGTNYQTALPAGTVNATTKSIVGKYYRFSGAGATPTGIDSTARRASIINKSPVFQDNVGGSFVLATGNTELNFFVCLPYNLAVLSCLDTTANATVSFVSAGNYIMKDAGGVDTTYHMYTATLGQAFSSSHNWTITIG